MFKTAKSRLTNARNALKGAVTGSQSVLAPIATPSTDQNENMDYLMNEKTAIEATRAKIQSLKDCVNESMEKLHVAFEMLEDTKQEAELDSFEEILQLAAEQTNEADQFCADLIGKRAAVEQLVKDLRSTVFHSTRNETRSNALDQSYHSTPTTPAIAPIMPPYLPRLEIPKFAGKKSEWENFWTIFSSNIHEQDISPMLKFNYLWQYLEGPARELVSRYQVSAENYPEAIACLQKKYGDSDSRIEDLLADLQRCKAEKRDTKSQIQLLEKITATMSQLAINGQEVDQRILLNIIFSKFDEGYPDADT
ncbi:hypothetical protein OSTOST_02924 [Ostertagia ostertagi]